jgi:ATP-dependent HslUV protease ATP-binding subunit HslU
MNHSTTQSTVKVEATKFTEVGYHGRDVDQIVRDLMDVSMQLTRRVWTEKLRQEASAVVEDRILDLLTGPTDATRGRESFRDMLQQGILDDQEVEVDVPLGGPPGDKNADMGGFGGDNNNPNVAAMTELWQRVSSGQGKKQSMERKKLPISEARQVILEIELERMLEAVDLKKEAIIAVEESGIVFIDEM